MVSSGGSATTFLRKLLCYTDFRLLFPMLKFVSKKPDPILLSTIIGLLVFGVLMVYDASVVYAYDIFGGKYHFLFRQLFWVLFGGLAAMTTFMIGYQRFKKLAGPLLMVSLLLLLFLAIPRFISFPLYDKFAPEVNGARRWIVLNPQGVFPAVPLLSRLSFQPSELAKFALVVYFAGWFSGDGRSTSRRFASRSNHNLSGHLPSLFSVVIPLALLSGLTLLEPDFVTAALIFVVGIWVYFVAGASLLPLLVGSLGFLALGSLFILASPYRRVRFSTFLNPSGADPLSTGYHLRQIFIALGSGGFFGVGLGESRQKYGYLPEAVGDSVLAIIGEELGFLGTAILISAFVVFLWRGFLVVKNAPDELSRFLAVGVVGWISVQALVNFCAMTGLVPLTGVTLPLVSYGGSSMIFSLAGIGLLLNISAESGKR